MKNKFTMFILIVLAVSTQILRAVPNDTIGLIKKDTVDLASLYIGLGFGQGIGGGLSGWSGKFAWTSGWGFSFNSQNHSRTSYNIPTDYIYEFLGESRKPKDKLTIISVNLLRQINTSNKKIRWGYEVGPALVIYTTPAFSPNLNYNAGVIFGSSNYFTTENSKTRLGINAKASMEFPFISFFGMGMAVNSQLNSLRSSVGYEIYFNFGFVRQKQSPKILPY